MRSGQMILFALLFAFVTSFTFPTPKVSRELLWTGHPFPYAHVCTITELANGEFVAAYQAGSGEDHADCGIWHSIRSTSGQWSAPMKAISMPKCQMNPSLYQNDEGTLYLMYHYNGGSDGKCHTHSWKGYYAVSTDGGRTFGNYTQLPKGILGSVKNNCIKLSNGDVMCPTSTEAMDEIIPIWSSHFEFTNDEFTTWEKTKSVFFFFGEEACQGIIQPTIFEYGQGKVRAMFRSSCGVLATAISEDYGRTWPYWAEDSHVPNPGAGIDMTMMKGTDLGAILLYNNSTMRRTPLSVAYTADDGSTWNHVVDIETDQGGSFEYPYVIQSRFDPKKAYVCYTYHSEGKGSIAFAELDFNE